MIIAHIKGNPLITREEIADIIGVSRTTIMKDLGSDGIFTMDDHAETHFNLNSEANKQVLSKIINDFGKNSGKKYMVDTDEANENFSYRTVFSVVISYPEVGNYYEAFKKVNYEVDALMFYIAKGTSFQ